jgi:hypothetical protein
MATRLSFTASSAATTALPLDAEAEAEESEAVATESAVLRLRIYEPWCVFLVFTLMVPGPLS